MKSDNNFDLLRLIFAFVVFLVHAQTLSQNTELATVTKWLSSEMAIRGFFVISGYLIYMSNQNSPSLAHYVQKRVRRIYPAYSTVILLCAMFGTVLTSLNLRDYLSIDLAKYLVANLLFLNFLEPDLPGVFERNYLQAVNGALWTLKIEVLFYMAVPLIAWLARRYGHLLVLSLLYIASVSYTLVLEQLYAASGQNLHKVLSHQLPGQLTYFIVGIGFYHWRDKFPKLRIWFLPALLVLCFVREPVMLVILGPMTLGAVVIAIAVVFRPLGHFGKHGDLSYGAYIVHFPILQALIQLGLFPSNGWQGPAIAIGLIIPVAYLCWHLVEKPWLQKSSHYVIATQPK